MTTEQVMEEGAASDFTAAAEDMRDIITFDDWRKKGYLNPVGDQGDGNCCYAFATCGVIEVLYCNLKKGKEYITLSPQDIYNNLVKNDKEDKEGCTVSQVLSWIIDNGCVLDKDCPYEETYRPSTDQRKVKLRIETSVHLDLDLKTAEGKVKKAHEIAKMFKNIEEEVKIAPVIAEMYWMPDMHDLKGDVIYYAPKDASSFKEAEMHGVVIVGFGELKMKKGKSTKYWIIRNSHGSDWGDGGYAKIDRKVYDGRSLITAAWAVRGLSFKDPKGVPYDA